MLHIPCILQFLELHIKIFRLLNFHHSFLFSHLKTEFLFSFLYFLLLFTLPLETHKHSVSQTNSILNWCIYAVYQIDNFYPVQALPTQPPIVTEMAATMVPVANVVSIQSSRITSNTRREFHQLGHWLIHSSPISSSSSNSLSSANFSNSKNGFRVLACFPPPPSFPGRVNYSASTKLFVSGLSFRTTEESLRNAFENFGKLVEVNLVMDKIANRPRGFAFLCYATEEESNKAIEGMHGKMVEHPNPSPHSRHHQDPSPVGQG